jgi:Ser/Thr protein kinase RdoA (MazF antagonist)
VLQAAVLHQSDVWAAYLAGYREVQPFGPADLAAVPYFVVAQSVWSIGHEVRAWAQWAGLTRVDDAFFDRQFAALRRWEAEQLDGQSH